MARRFAKLGGGAFTLGRMLPGPGMRACLNPMGATGPA